tara:strand:- start:286 stop:504 length:219 start_codon:yes stop_codon:yes gene_type:complete
MDKIKVIEILETIENQLSDSVNSLPEYNSNVDSRGYIDGALCDLYHLKDELERTVLDEKKDSKLQEEWSAGC